MQRNIFLSLGSNIGDRARNLSCALSFLQSNGIFIERLSSLYETEPIGPKQRKFYNLCLKARSNLTPLNLLFLIKDIEKTMGRKKTKRWGRRIIDIDILFFGNLVLKSKKLTLPHPETAKRLFVLMPLNEIAPEFKCASFGAKAKMLLKKAGKDIQKQQIKVLESFI